jgi:hypothetical protein
MSADAEYQVLAVRYGTRKTSAAEVFLNFHSYGEPDRPLTMDYFFWIARNPSRAVVIDTGFSPEGGASRGRTMLMDTAAASRAAGAPPDAVGQVAGQAVLRGGEPRGHVRRLRPDQGDGTGRGHARGRRTRPAGRRALHRPRGLRRRDPALPAPTTDGDRWR